MRWTTPTVTESAVGPGGSSSGTLSSALRSRGPRTPAVSAGYTARPIRTPVSFRTTLRALCTDQRCLRREESIRPPAERNPAWDSIDIARTFSPRPTKPRRGQSPPPIVKPSSVRQPQRTDHALGSTSGFHVGQPEHQPARRRQQRARAGNIRQRIAATAIRSPSPGCQAPTRSSHPM
jgi:hypothetical protein